MQCIDIVMHMLCNALTLKNIRYSNRSLQSTFCSVMSFNIVKYMYNNNERNKIIII